MSKLFIIVFLLLNFSSLFQFQVLTRDRFFGDVLEIGGVRGGQIIFK